MFSLYCVSDAARNGPSFCSLRSLCFDSTVLNVLIFTVLHSHCAPFSSSAAAVVKAEDSLQALVNSVNV